MNRPFLGAAGVATIAVAALPAHASAVVTATLDKPCYTHIPTVPGNALDTVSAALAGGTPGGGFVLTANGPKGIVGSTNGTFDPAGNAVAQITDLSPPSFTINPSTGQQVTFSIRDYGAPAPVDQPLNVTALVTNLALDVDLKNARPTAPRRVRVSGAPFANQSMYGFLVHGKTGRHVYKRISLGKGNVCGYTSRKVSIAPRGLRSGSYYLYVNAGKKLDKNRGIGKGLVLRRLF